MIKYRLLPLMLVLAVCGLPQAVSASTILLSDNFNGQNGGTGALNYSGFSNFNVTKGAVDLIGNGLFDFKPGNGLYVDINGTTGKSGTIESKTNFALGIGTFTLKFDLAGSQRAFSPLDSITVSLGNLFSQTFTKAFTDPFQTITITGTNNSNTTGSLTFGSPIGDGDLAGLLIDNVQLTFDPAGGGTGVAAPEPSSVILWSLGALGFGYYRNRRRETRAA